MNRFSESSNFLTAEQWRVLCSSLVVITGSASTAWLDSEEAQEPPLSRSPAIRQPTSFTSARRQSIRPLMRTFLKAANLFREPAHQA